MVEPQEPDRRPLFRKKIQRTASPIYRPAKRLAEDNGQYLAAKHSLSGLNLIRHYSDHPTDRHGIYVSGYIGRESGDGAGLSPQDLLSVPVPGGRIFGDLFHGLDD